MKKHRIRIAKPRVKIPSSFEALNLLGKKWPEASVVEYVRTFTRLNQLKPCTMIINGVRVEA